MNLIYQIIYRGGTIHPKISTYTYKKFFNDNVDLNELQELYIRTSKKLHTIICKFKNGDRYISYRYDNYHYAWVYDYNEKNNINEVPSRYTKII
jgi:hypothetical protein